MNDFKERAIRGSVAKMVAQGANFALRLGSLMVLARLLGPTDFGLVGMVTAFTGVLSLLKECGLSTATVQKVSITDEEISTLFWINVIVGAALSLVAFAAAPIIVTFYREPRLFWVMTVLASGFFFNGLGVQHTALLQRQMRFMALAAIEMTSLVVASAAAIGMAMLGFGYWALVAWSVVVPLVSTALAWLQARWIPGPPRRHTGTGSMMRFGGIVTLNTVVAYVAYNLDKVLLGRLSGAEVVGIYGRAYQLVILPTDHLNSAASGVAFPVLSRLQQDPERLRSYFLKGYSLVLSLTIPITAACALFASQLILLILGPKWNDAVPIFRLLTPTILVLALINPTGWLLVALGLIVRSLKLALALLPVVVTGCVLGLPYGPRGVALGYSVAMVVWVVPHLLWCFHGTVVSFRDVVVVASRPLLSGIVGVVFASVVLLFGGSLPALAVLVIGLAVLFTVYALMLLFVMGQKTLYLDLLLGLRGRTSENAVSSA